MMFVGKSKINEDITRSGLATYSLVHFTYPYRFGTNSQRFALLFLSLGIHQVDEGTQKMVDHLME
jgi:hypothetical protein